MAIFRKNYPFLNVEATTDIGSQDAAERLFAEETSGRNLTDVISVSLTDLSEVLRRNYIARNPTPATAAVLPQMQKYNDPEGRWALFFWSEHGISYNSNMVPKDKAPKQWEDLCNPFFKGSVSFDPAEARYIAGLYAIMGEERLMKFMECIGKNNPIIQRGHTQRIELMLAGDHMVQGDNYLYHGLTVKRKTPVGAVRDGLHSADHCGHGRVRHQPQHEEPSCRGSLRRLDADEGEPGVYRQPFARTRDDQASLSA